ncbi:MAG: hypothetical protein ACR2JO_10525 [Mycobacteriales bacterium]
MATQTALTGEPAAGERIGQPRATIGLRTLRRDRWWVSPAITVAALLGFIAYLTWAGFINRDYYTEPYISPLYSPCLADNCTTGGSHLLGNWWRLSPALLILAIPLGFRMTCYYYRKAYYRSFWLSPPACAVAEPHKRYTGETRFPLVFQNIHRYFFYAGLLLNVILTYDAFAALRFGGRWGFGLGTLVLLVNATLLWLYSLSCHSCRHVVGGRLRNFSRHPLRYRAWTFVSRLNARHMQLAWASLAFVAFTDLYVRLVASGTITDPRFLL